MNKKLDVLIIGAGPTGLTLALALSRYGLSFRIVERASGPSVVSKAIGIQARSLELFARLGVAEDLMENAIKINQGNLYVNGAWQAKLDFTDLNTPFPFVTLLPQSETERILEARLATYGHVVERETELTGFAQFPTFVTASLQHKGETETVDASFIIGADGANSFVRRELGLRSVESRSKNRGHWLTSRSTGRSLLRRFISSSLIMASSSLSHFSRTCSVLRAI